MKKVGILTFHYSNNFGGVLQCYSLYKYLKLKGIDVEVIDYIPSTYKNNSVFRSTGLRANIFKTNKEDLNLKVLAKRIGVKIKYNKSIINKFDNFRENNMTLSKRVDEHSINELVNKYDSIIVGSDQVWNPGRRSQKEYFLNFDNNFDGKKISYAADSTIPDIRQEHIEKLKKEVRDFDFISVRNEHSHKFVKTLTGKNADIVVDPSILYKFDNFKNTAQTQKYKKEKYILVYALGEELKGGNKKAIDKIKEVYGNLKVYAITIPTMKFNICNYADKVLYDLGPEEWVDLIKNAEFIFTDSFHGTLFSMKFHKPFLAYYAEDIRSTRFKDLEKRYKIGKFIVNSLDMIDESETLKHIPNYEEIDKLIAEHKEQSIKFIERALDLE